MSHYKPGAELHIIYVKAKLKIPLSPTPQQSVHTGYTKVEFVCPLSNTPDRVTNHILRQAPIPTPQQSYTSYTQATCNVISSTCNVISSTQSYTCSFILRYMQLQVSSPTPQQSYTSYTQAKNNVQAQYLSRTYTSSY